MDYRYYQKAAIEAIAQYIYATPAGYHPLVAMPTGTGKSIVQDGFVYEFLMMYPQLRFLCVTHSKHLVGQNEATMRRMWEYAPTGIYSAGLKRRDTAMPIIFGGIQSMIKHVEEFGWRDFVFIDEAHLVSPDEETMYGEFIRRILAINPNCRFIGLTATAFRNKSGELAGNGGIFTDLCYDLSSMEWFNRLIAEGYLSPLVPRPTVTEYDVSKLSMSKGDYAQGQMEAEFDRAELTRAVLTEVCNYGADRRSWLTFTAGIKHAEHVNDMLLEFGVSSVVVHSKIGQKESDKRIKAYQNGEVRSIVNFGVLTTGFDDPKTDLINMLRATQSPGLWVQMLGRGTRPSPMTGKINCLCLDFAGNTRRLGPINDPVIPRRKKSGGGGGTAPIKICKKCGNWCHASVRFCEWCNEEFLQNVALYEQAGTDELIRSDLPIIEEFNVQRVWLNKGGKAGARPYLQATYYVEGNLLTYKEFVLLEHDGLPKHKAHNWWKQRHSTEPPETVDEALAYLSNLRTPRKIKVWVNKIPYAEVVGHEF